MDFDKRYEQLNDAQKSAVDAIDGPVMVIAGPGTGKTELLSMRAANILKKTDVLPENILCLTFTDAGSVAMQKRLTSIIGRDAYNVSIFTFHAFGSEIMNKYREYFYNGASFQLGDELARHRIITEILDSRDYNSPLRSQMNGKYTSIKSIMAAISDLKRASLTDEEFRLLLDQVQATVEIAGPKLTEVFNDRISKATKDKLAAIIPDIEAIHEETPISGFIPLKTVLANSLKHAVQDAEEHEKTTPPLTAWKKEWMTSAPDKSQILKVQKSLPKLRELNVIYELYLQIMTKAELLDYDDMIMQTVHAIEVNSDLRYDLQEKYQYIMVDEFQDTNMAQMRILHNLTNNPVVEDTPNILVVGDDDQAIYGFQGAEVGNILNFVDTYKKTKLITLTDNYRSTQPILDGARDVISQGQGRLEARIDKLDKKLTAHTTKKPLNTEIVNFHSTHAERDWIAKSIKKLIDDGTNPSEIAVIARKHADLISLLSYIASENIPVSYDKRDNVLDDDIIQHLVLMGTIINALATGSHIQANALIPEFITHPAWNADPILIWKISTEASKNQQHWLEVMSTHPETEPIFKFLVEASMQSAHLPLEMMLDIMIGNTEIDGFASPLKKHYFEKAEEGDAKSYVDHLENLTAIRQKLRENSAGGDQPKLKEFLKFIDDTNSADIQITSVRHIGEDDKAVQLMSAHGSKGLEFDHVFIVNATDSMWGEKARAKSPDIAFPPHLRLRKNNDDYDERLRLFYVAMTRARIDLHISYANENDSAKEMLRAAFLLDSKLKCIDHTDDEESTRDLEAVEKRWYAPIVNIPSVSMREYLDPVLKDYKLSATHVNNFIDIINSGPQKFLLDSLLHFPSAPSAPANYGTAIHGTLQRAHEHIRVHGSLLPEEDVLGEFENQMEKMIFTDDERRHYTHQGADTLRAFLRAKYDTFTSEQIAELNFNHQNVYIDEAHLTGKLDVVDFDKENFTAKVTDYKTGGTLESWDKGDLFKKVKAHKYKQQLLFYKLLIENSRDYRKFTMDEGVLQFVEPNDKNEIADLHLSTIDHEELDRFKELVKAVWQHIQDLNFPDTSNYEQNIDGIKKFENDLIEGKI